MKVCKGSCTKELSLDCFRRAGYTKDGSIRYKSYCKSCQSKREKRQKELLKEKKNSNLTEYEWKVKQEYNDEGKKKCISCEQWKNPQECYHHRQGNWDNLRKECNECFNKKKRKTEGYVKTYSRQKREEKIQEGIRYLKCIDCTFKPENEFTTIKGNYKDGTRKRESRCNNCRNTIRRKNNFNPSIQTDLSLPYIRYLFEDRFAFIPGYRCCIECEQWKNSFKKEGRGYSTRCLECYNKKSVKKKQCTKCNLWKYKCKSFDKTEYGHKSECKKCSRNLNKITTRKGVKGRKCNKCNEWKEFDKYRKNNEKTFKTRCKACEKEDYKERRKNTKIYDYQQTRRNNEKKLLHNQTNQNAKLSGNLRTRLGQVLKGNPKKDTTMNLVGCDIDFLWKHLESKFTKGMTRENYGEWHVDHIVPCAHFNLQREEEQRRCFHWRNLQPLWGHDNAEKSNKYTFNPTLEIQLYFYALNAQNKNISPL